MAEQEIILTKLHDLLLYVVPVLAHAKGCVLVAGEICLPPDERLVDVLAPSALALLVFFMKMPHRADPSRQVPAPQAKRPFLIEQPFALGSRGAVAPDAVDPVEPPLKQML